MRKRDKRENGPAPRAAACPSIDEPVPDWSCGVTAIDAPGETSNVPLVSPVDAPSTITS